MLEIYKTRNTALFLGILLLDYIISFGHITLILNASYELFSNTQTLACLFMFTFLLFCPLLFTPLIKLNPPSLKKMTLLSLGLNLPLFLAYQSGNFWICLWVTPFLAMQFFLFFQRKISYFFTSLMPNQLTQGHSCIALIFYSALLFSVCCFTFVFQAFFIPTSNPTQALGGLSFMGWVFALFSGLSVFCSFMLPTLSYQTTQPSLKETFKNKKLLQCCISTAVICGIFILYILMFPNYLANLLEINPIFSAFLSLTCFCFGAGIGAYMTSAFSKNYLETGLASFGFLNVILGSLLLLFTHSLLAFALLFVLIGIGVTLITISLNSLVQFQGQIPTFTLQSIAIAICTFLALAALFFQINNIWFLIFGLIISTYTGYKMISSMPFLLVRLLVTIAFNQRYRLIVEGFCNIPHNQGALLLGNHISFIDWAIVQMAIPRKIHFVIEHNTYSKWYIKLFLNKIGNISISTIQAPQTIELIQKLLQEGELVCLFPEETISRHGHLNEFKDNYEKISQNLSTKIPIIPFYIRGLWGSAFSRSDEQFQARNHSFLAKRNITIAFGEALDIHTPKAQLKNIIFDLSFKAWKSHCERMPTISRAWIATAKAHLSSIAIVDSNSGEFTYRKLLALSLLLSKKWRNYKYTSPTQSFAPENECMGILLPASFASSLCNLSILLANKVAVNLNFTSGQNSINQAIKASNIQRILTSKKFLEKLADKGVNLSFPNVEMLYMEDLVQEIKKQKLLTLGYLAIATLLPSFILQEWFAPEEDTSKVATILFSSGSEGTPKGVMLNHLNIMSNIDQISNILCIQDSDAILSSLPPFHAFGLTVTTFLPLLAGIPSIAHADPTDALGIAKAIAKNEVTIMCGTSTFLNLYARNPKLDSTMFESLRIVVSGAEKLKVEIREAFESKFHRLILEGYGTTETTPVVSVNLQSKFDSQSWQLHTAGKNGSVGMPLPGTTIRIVDPNSLQTLPHNEDGLVLVGGHQVMVGYLNDIEKTNSVVIELDGIRWYKTGDKGYLDDDGFLYITDRYSRFAKVGGEMVSLGKIEEEAERILKEDKNFTDTRVLATAIEDSKKGEMVVLLIQTQTQELFNQATSLIKSSPLPPIYKPSRFLFVEQIPLLGSGKADLKGAKTLAQELLK